MSTCGLLDSQETWKLYKILFSRLYPHLPIFPSKPLVCLLSVLSVALCLRQLLQIHLPLNVFDKCHPGDAPALRNFQASETKPHTNP